MLTIRSRVMPTGAWLVARLYRQRVVRELRFSIRLFVGGQERQVANGLISERFDDLLAGVRARAFASVNQFEEALRDIGRQADFSYLFVDAALAAQQALDAMGGDYHDAPVPVFAATDFSMSEETWAALLHASIAASKGLRRRVEVIPAPVGRRSQVELRSKMVLPVDIHIPNWLAGPLSKETWFLGDDAVSRFGLRMHESDAALPLNSSGDVLVGDASNITRWQAEQWLGQAANSARLRILVNVSFDPLWEPGLVRGTATMLFPRRSAAETITRLDKLFNAITHDRPLHYALHEARFGDEMGAQLEQWFRGPRLYADPEVDQWFRLSNALPQAVEAAASTYAVGMGASMGPFLGRLREHLPPSPELENTFLRLDDVHLATEPLRTALGNGVYFSYESAGLKPMSQILAAKAAYDARHQQLVDALVALRSQPGATDALEAAQERRVDASLQLSYGDQPPRTIPPNEGVPSNAQLELSVSIGQRTEKSLIVGDTPALDPLLPSLEGDESHDIDIVLFEKDFTLGPGESNTRTVTLGRFGGTAPVSWKIVAPRVQGHGEEALSAPGARKWETGDVAELRFSLYFRNQLLQSFNMRAVLGDSFPWQVQGSVEIKCDFSQTRRFGSLDKLEDRLINLSLNDSTDGRHTLAVKGDGFQPSAVTWDSVFLVKQVDVLRDAIFSGMAKNGKPIFLFNAEKLHLETLPTGTFESAVQEMAIAGSALYDQLYFLNSPPLREALARARKSRDQTIQIGLLQSNYTLPWGLIYDFDLPNIKSGQLADVCRGRDEHGNACKCMPDDGTKICLRGFWGFRHTVEQLVGTLDPLDETGGISPQPTKPVMGFVRTLSDAYTDTLSDLFKVQGAEILEYPDPQSFVDLFEQEATRPALVMYVGHQDVEGPAQAPTPKLLTYASGTLLRLRDVRKRLDAKKIWNVPRSLVLLLGCATGAERVDAGIGLAGALLELGAIGVLGTECTVYTDLVARVARDLRLALFAGAPMGKALHDVVQQLADEGCPMGLAFTYLGPIKAGLPK
jgi:hypothetical protein